MSLKEKLKKMIERSKSRPRLPEYDEEGRLICDPNPLKYPVGFKKPPSKEESLMRILKAHNEQMAFNARYEDETDFDIDTPDMLSSYERNAHVFDLEPETPYQAPRSAPQNADAAEPDLPEQGKDED